MTHDSVNELLTSRRNEAVCAASLNVPFVTCVGTLAREASSWGMKGDWRVGVGTGPSTIRWEGNVVTGLGKGGVGMYTRHDEYSISGTFRPWSCPIPVRCIHRSARLSPRDT